MSKKFVVLILLALSLVISACQYIPMLPGSTPSQEQPAVNEIVDSAPTEDDSTPEPSNTYEPQEQFPYSVQEAGPSGVVTTVAAGTSSSFAVMSDGSLWGCAQFI